MFFYKWTHGLRGKLLLLGVLPIVIFISISIFSINIINKLQEKINFANSISAKSISYVGHMDASIHATGRWAWIIYGLNGDVEKRKKFIKLSKDQLIIFDKEMEEYLKLPSNEQIKDTFLKVQDLWPKTKLGVEEAPTHFELQTTEENEIAKKVLVEKVLPYLVPITENFNKINKLMNTHLDQV